MINFSDMIDMKRYRPGKEVKCMLLYFPIAKEYVVHKDCDSALGKFAFKDKNSNVFLTSLHCGKN